MMQKGTPVSIRVSREDEGKRFDRFLSEAGLSHPLSRSLAKRLIEEGLILLNGRRVKASFPLRQGDRATGIVPEIGPLSPGSEALPLKILYEDADILVIDKPAGLVVQPSTTGSTGTLVDILLHRRRSLAESQGMDRPGIVHRLDKDTSGVMVVAKTESALVDLGRQFKGKGVEKIYRAIVHGRFDGQAGTIEAAIGKHPTERKKMATQTSGGKSAITHWKVLETFSGYSLLEIRPRTGRTHQIRVHLASAGHPVLGDLLYGGKKRPGAIGDIQPRESLKNLDRQALHACRLTFTHPRTGERVTFCSPLPPDMGKTLQGLRRMGPL